MEPQDNPIEIPIDTETVRNLPGVLPRKCPSCDRQFSQVLKPPRRLIKRAKLILAFGLCLSIAWAGLLWLIFRMVTSNMDYVIIPVNWITGGITLLVIAVPGYFVGLKAMELPRTVQLACRQCGWKQQYLIDETGRVVDPT